MDTVKLLLHPVRLRIVLAMSGGRAYTAVQLLARMPDVSKATMYRQIALLFDGGILELDSEQKVGGTVERCYRLHESRAVISTEAVASASLEDYRIAFTTSMTAMLGEFNAYLDRGHADPGADGVGFRQHSIWLTENERNELMNVMRKAIMPFLKNEPEPGRRQHVLSPILFPSDDLLSENK